MYLCKCVIASIMYKIVGYVRRQVRRQAIVGYVCMQVRGQAIMQVCGRVNTQVGHYNYASMCVCEYVTVLV